MRAGTPAAGRVVVVGSVNTDLVVRLPTLPRPGETVRGDEFLTVGGGKGANGAVAAARLGARVVLLACLGDDDFGAARRADLAAEAIDLAGTLTVPGVASGVALIAVDAAGENTVVVVPGANARLTPAAVDALTLDRRDVLLTQLEVPLPTVEAALRRARDSGARALLNAAPFLPAAAALLPLVSVLIVNELEAGDLLDGARVTPESAASAVTTLLARGPDAVALTLGAHGAWVGTGHEQRHLPAPPVAVVDTTGAGDCFCGALAAGLATGDALFPAAARAVLAGSLAVTRAGAQPSMPRRAAVDEASRHFSGA